jgi:hypothetical protein
MKAQCWSCYGKGTDVFGDACDDCGGAGWEESSRLVTMNRRKPFLGRRDPRADAHGNEKWPRMTVEVPPEVAVEMERIAKKLWRGHTMKPPSRSAIVRAALVEWMERHDPEPDAPLESSAEEILERLELGT